MAKVTIMAEIMTHLTISRRNNLNFPLISTPLQSAHRKRTLSNHHHHLVIVKIQILAFGENSHLMHMRLLSFCSRALRAVNKCKHTNKS